jgi:thiol-disulfide isomerase/thioredoxin
MKTPASVLTLLFLASVAAAQSLFPGSPCPGFKGTALLKGKVLKSPQKGRVAVVEFWATWCRPCIEAMPHLSTVADRYHHEVDFVSINVRDRPIRNGKLESRKDQLTRIKKWVTQNESKMRYNVVLDDENQTQAKAWLDASGSYSIPRVFIVDGQGKIGWIGHPDDLEEALKSVMSGTNDVARNRAQVKSQSNEFEEIGRVREAFAEPIAKGDADGFDSVLSREYKLPLSTLEFGLQSAALGNPPFALNRLKHYSKLPNKIGKNDACMVAGMIANNAKDPRTREEALALSERFAKESREKIRIYAFWYHAQTLRRLGDVQGSDKWIKKVESMRGEISADRWESLRKSISKFVGKS